jgi:GTPase SAR1 family protein
MVKFGKVNIVGLANAGKTSMILTLLREFKSLEKIKPTKGINRTKFKFLNRELALWDMGGQSRYREEYLKRPELNFAEIEELIYVFDVQDKSIFDESVIYFRDVAAYVKQYSPSANISLCLHKYDPGLDRNPDFVKSLETVVKRFKEVSSGLPVRVNYTSIYNPMSVVLAFSKPLFGNSTLYDNFSYLFQDAINKSGIDFAMVVTENFMEIGNAFAPYLDPEKTKGLSEEIFKTIEEKKMKAPDISAQLGNIAITMILFEAGGKPFYFTYGYSKEKYADASPIHADMQNLLQDVKKFMKYF